MNEHQISQLSFQQVLELWGAGRSSLVEGENILIDEAIARFTENEVEAPFRKSLVVAKVISLDDLSPTVGVERIWRFYEDGGSSPETGQAQVPISILKKTASERLRETDNLL